MLSTILSLECVRTLVNLPPKVGDPFTIEWKIKHVETDEGNSHFATIILNGKKFEDLKIGTGEGSPFPFTQNLVFDDHHFRLYSVHSTGHATTSYRHYFRRHGDTFYLVNPSPTLTLNYDYSAQMFYGIQGQGRSQYRRTNYKLEENRLIETWYGEPY